MPVEGCSGYEVGMRSILPIAVLVGCAAGGGPDPSRPVPDFSLEDVNPSSARFETAVSPRDLKGQVSGWYFGHAT